MTIAVQLTHGKFALIDDADLDLIKGRKWVAHFERGRWYAWSTNPDCGHILMHRVILGLADPLVLTDHRDGDGLNNQRTNIREASSSQNGFNKSKPKGSASTKLGVYFFKPVGRWTGQIRSACGARLSVGYYDSEDEAALARDHLAAELHGRFAKLNNPALFPDVLTREPAAPQRVAQLRAVSAARNGKRRSPRRSFVGDSPVFEMPESTHVVELSPEPEISLVWLKEWDMPLKEKIVRELTDKHERARAIAARIEGATAKRVTAVLLELIRDGRAKQISVSRSKKFYARGKPVDVRVRAA